MLARALGRPASGARPMLDDWLLGLPVVGAAAAALGAVPATADSLRRVLAAGEVAIGFPEGPEAVAKPLARRYRLAPFGRASLVRVAAEAGAPVVPVAVVGAEEAQPVLWRSEWLGRLLGLPAVPVPPPFVLLPTKWTIHVGEPLEPPARADRRLMRGFNAAAARATPGAGERQRQPASRPLRLSAAAMRFVVAIDQGTTGTTVLVLDRRGRVCGRAYREFTQYFPQPRLGRARSRGDLAGHARRAARRRAGAPAPAGATSPASASRTSARRRSCGTGARGRPVHRAIVWQDRRTAEHCDALRAAGAEDLRAAQDGSRPRPVLQRDEAALAARARAPRGRACGTGRAVLRHHRLVAGVEADGRRGARHRPDQCVAHAAVRHPRAALGPRALPALRGPATPCCRRCDRRAACSARPPPDVLGAPVPIAGIAGDQQSALFGQGCTAPGMAKNTYGTGCFLLLHTGQRPVGSSHGLLTTVACDERGGPAYALEGAVFVAGAAIQWLRDGLGLLARAAESEKLRAQRRRLARGLRRACLRRARRTVLGPGGARRRPRAHARRDPRPSGARDARVARLPDPRRVDAMAADAGAPLGELRVDGGAAANDFLMQFQADLLGVPVERPSLVETTAVGAAQLAGLAVGFWKSPRELARHTQEGSPLPAAHDGGPARGALPGLAGRRVPRADATPPPDCAYRIRLLQVRPSP